MIGEHHDGWRLIVKFSVQGSQLGVVILAGTPDSLAILGTDCSRPMEFISSADPAHCKIPYP